MLTSMLLVAASPAVVVNPAVDAKTPVSLAVGAKTLVVRHLDAANQACVTAYELV